MEPRLEPIEVAQGGELPPHLDEGHLDRVLGEVGVAQDPMRDEDAAVADLTNQGAEDLLVDLTNQGAEGLLVALPRLVHDRSQHPLPPVFDAGAAPSTSMSVGVVAIVRYRRLETARDRTTCRFGTLRPEHRSHAGGAS